MLKRIWLSTTSLANQISTGTDTPPSPVERKPSLIQSRRGRLILLCAIVFVLASAVRLLYFEDRFTEIERGTSFLTTLVKPYRQDALQMLEDSFYSFISSGEASADDNHEEFGVAKVAGGIFVSPELTDALGIPRGILPTGCLCVIDVPKGPRGDALLRDVTSGKKLALSSVIAIQRELIEEE